MPMSTTTDMPIAPTSTTAEEAADVAGKTEQFTSADEQPRPAEVNANAMGEPGNNFQADSADSADTNNTNQRHHQPRPRDHQRHRDARESSSQNHRGGARRRSFMRRGVDTRLLKVFVGNIPYATQRSTLESIFGDYGKIVEAVIIADQNTGRSKGYGFVTFANPASTARIVFSETPFVIEGRTANCTLAYANQMEREGQNPSTVLDKLRQYLHPAWAHMALHTGGQPVADMSPYGGSAVVGLANGGSYDPSGSPHAHSTGVVPIQAPPCMFRLTIDPPCYMCATCV
ncbi:uncharacterized protein MONBRDRAFT_30329 [Monosiga brevicollis MX1]|uniref:RRM domain-containing protein n=1 Tax=Monosiga brevicollis TaxID=81824 RepID=A9VDN2_MONBE|nr:uncharacterized protein MONBRDRAFT_30329 [Monosiga brevicollis MX1]EDQ84330.1 predicted protein [Monosiga brevicollis MX1]|eukprot:XP_001750826.1 hypothetical protein [Monosiga brevicollis MX1]